MRTKIISIAFVILTVLVIVSADEIALSNVKVNYDKTKVVVAELPNGGKKFTMDSSGQLTASYNGKTIDFSGMETIEGKKPEIVMNNEGKVVEAQFKTGKDGPYILGNEEIVLPKGTEVKFKDKVCEIKYPAGVKTINPPKPIGNNPGETEFVFKTADNKFALENGNNFEGEALKYKNGKYYFDSDAKLDETLVKNPKKVKTYLDFNGKVNGDYDSPYISIDRKNGKIVIGSNVNIPGPAVSFTKDNPFGIRLLENDHFAVQTLGNSNGAYVSIQNMNSKGEVPYIETLNQFVINEDTKSPYYNSDTGKLYLRAKESIIKDFPDGTSTTPVQIVSYRNHNGVLELVSKYNNVLGFGDNGEIGYGNNPSFISTYTSWGNKNNPNFMKGYSNSWFYYNMKTAGDFEKFFGNRIRLIDETGVLKDPNNVRIMTDLIANVPRVQQDSIKTISLENPNWRWSGLADSDGMIMHLVAPDSIPISTARHEMTHLLDFEYGRNSNFRNTWNSIGGNRGPHTYDYGYNDMEDRSTLGEYVYKDPDTWRKYLDPNYKYSSKFIGRVAIFTKYGFFTQAEGARILGTVNLASDPASLDRYIQNAQQAYRQYG